MATKPKSSPVAAKKPAVKAKSPANAKKVSEGALAKPPKDQPFSMPMEVKEWIDRAQSIMNHQRNQIETLKQENKQLKEWRKWAEHRILRSDHE